MAKPIKLQEDDWYSIVHLFETESDRGVAVLTGGFLEHYLGAFLKGFVVDEKAGASLFDASGPLSSFSQRIALARAFGFIDETQYRELNLIRKIRNFFAHHPLDASFQSQEVKAMAEQLRGHKMAAAFPIESQKHSQARVGFLMSCGWLCGNLSQRMSENDPANPDLQNPFVPTTR